MISCRRMAARPKLVRRKACQPGGRGPPEAGANRNSIRSPTKRTRRSPGAGVINKGWGILHIPESVHGCAKDWQQTPAVQQRLFLWTFGGVQLTRLRQIGLCQLRLPFAFVGGCA